MAACSGEPAAPATTSTAAPPPAAATDAAPAGGEPVVFATAESAPSTSNPDDVAVWAHPDDPAASRIITTEKNAGLAVYDLDGRLVQALGHDGPNNVDLRYGFPWDDGEGAIITAGYRRTETLGVLRVDAASGELREVASLPLRFEPYGSCMYRSAADGSFYVFVNEKSGDFKQYRLVPDTTEGVDLERVRSWDLDSQPEGCVADDERAVLYMGEEAAGIWRLGAEPDDDTDPVLVDGVDGGRLTPDVEGLALYPAATGGGYLVAASQGSGEFVVYDRLTDAHVLTFRIEGGPIDGVAGTDGIDIAGGLGALFPGGVFVAHDPQDETGAANFKLVPWERIAALTDPPLALDPDGPATRASTG